MKRAVFLLAVHACSHRPAERALPDTPAGHQLRWVFDGLANGGRVDDAAIRAHFAAAFLARVPAAKLVQVFHEVSPLVADLRLAALEAADPQHLVAHVTTPRDDYVFTISTDPTGQISGLLMAPEPMKSIDQALATLAAIPGRAQLLVAELDRGRCRPLHAYNADAELAIGSTLKLYVLLALADQIAAGALTWDQELAVRDDWKSLPSGITQDEPAGTRHAIRVFADRMISISDNTATDHLLSTVGRDRVEAAMRSAGHRAPARNTPFLATRELFWFKLMMSAAERAAYARLDVTGRRAFVDGLAGKHPVEDSPDGWVAPRDIDTLEWFASSTDLCNAMATLLARSGAPTGRPILEVLGKNPGLPSPAGWRYVGFKGGSEPGVLSGTWLLQRADDRWFVVTMTINDPAHAIDEARLAIAQSVIALLATE